ncbi:MAG: serine/threonine-protein kinase [Pirellulaceae bacterium]
MPQSKTSTQWLALAVERRIIENTVALELMADAAASDHSISTLIQSRFSERQDIISRLLEIENEVSSNNSEESSNSRFTDQTLVGGLRNPSAVDPSAGVHSGHGTGASVSSNQARRSTLRNEQSRPTLGTHRDGLNRKAIAAMDGLATIHNRYETLGEIGKGGCGVVNRARDGQLEREVVIKKIVDDSISSDTVLRFINEARITGRLEHPGIVPVYELGIDIDGLPYYAMKHLRGETLADVIGKHQLQSKSAGHVHGLHVILNRFLDVCQALAYAHKQRIIHRDLKPSNIMIGEFGETIVLDWGLARELTQTDSECDQVETLAPGKKSSRDSESGVSSSSNKSGAGRKHAVDKTRQGAVLGTAAYMAPEQAKGLNDLVDEKSDVFSLGVILYEILSGVSPFRSDTVERTIEKVAQCEYRPLRTIRKNIPRPLASICAKAMSMDQGKRYAHAGELAEDLQSWLSGGTVSAYQERIWERMDRLAGKHKVLVRTTFLAIIVVTISSLVATGMVMQANNNERFARLLAEESQQKTELALAAEQQALDRTIDQLELSRAAADQWLIGLSGSLQFYPGLQPIREQLIADGEVHYEELLSRYGDSPEEQLASARTRIRLGDLSHLQGNRDSALQHFENAISQLQSLSDDSLCSKRNVELANASLGLALTSDSNLAERLKGLDDASIAMREELNVNPGNHEARNALVRNRMVSARLLADSGVLPTAIENLQSVLSDVEILTQSQHDLRHFTLKLNLLQDISRLNAQAGNQMDSIQSSNDVIAFIDRVVKESGSRPDWLETRSLANMNRANALIRQHRVVEASEAYEQASNDLDQAWDLLYGEEFYRENRSLLEANQGQAALQLGLLEVAETKLTSAQLGHCGG